MEDFCKKTIGGTSLGEILTQARLTSRLDIRALSTATRVQEKYLRAFEAGDYRALPELVYQRFFLRTIADVLGLDGTALLERHEFELAQAVGAQHAHQRIPRYVSRLAFLVAPRLLSAIGVGCAVLVALVGLGLEIRHIVIPPPLTLENPVDGALLKDPTVAVTGKTEQGVAVRVNGELVYLNPDGSFVEPVHLHHGLNVIKISARKTHSDERVVYRRVLWNGETAAGSGGTIARP